MLSVLCGPGYVLCGCGPNDETCRVGGCAGGGAAAVVLEVTASRGYLSTTNPILVRTV